MSIPVGPPVGSPEDPSGATPPSNRASQTGPTRASLYGRANALVLAWFLLAALTALGGQRIQASPWLMVHLLLLGGVSTAILLWSQHFADTLLRRPSPGGRRWLWGRLLGWSCGAALVVAGVTGEFAALTILGGLALVAVAVTHLTLLIRQARGHSALANRYAHLVRYYLVATTLLPAGITFGVLLARLDVSPGAQGRLYLAHVLTMLLGWVGMTVAGTIVLLWPTVLHTKLSDADDRAGRQALWTMGCGIAAALGGTAAGLRWLVGVGAVIVAAGILLLLVHAWAQGKQAATGAVSRTGGGFAAWSIASALIWFLGCVLAAGLTVTFAENWVAIPTAFDHLVLPFAVGFTGQIVLGSMTYLLPVVLGGGPRGLRWSQREMSRFGAIRIVVLNASLALLLLPLPPAVRTAVLALGFTTLAAFLVLALRTLLIQRGSHPRTVAPPQPTATTRDTRQTRTGRGLAIGAGLVALVVAAGVAVDPGTAGATWFPDSSSGASTVTATGETTTVQVRMEGMRFYPDVIEVPAGNALVIELTNDGDQVHDLVLSNGADSGRLYPGESATVEAGVITDSLPGWCSVAGHRQMGMTLEVVVIDSKGEANPDGEPTDATTMADHSAMGTTGDSAASDLDFSADAPEDFAARDATLAPAPTSGTNDQGVTSSPDPDGEGTLHEVTFTVGEALAEVAPGVEAMRWTFNGQAPGPLLRGQVGDTFEITLINDGTIGHSIDFHAGALAPDEPMRTIPPGASLTYTFRATRSGIWMYHCSTVPMSMHIANGMFGAVVIDPPDLPEVDREYILVQSELYLGPQGEVADPDRIASQNADIVAFNGYANQYRFEPLQARVGERVRIWVLDVGPNRPSSFHIVGGQFDTVFFEGDYLLRDGGSSGTGGSQALGLQSAQGGFVELTFPEAGHYTALTHIMSDAEKGATATVEVTD